LGELYSGVRRREKKKNASFYFRISRKRGRKKGEESSLWGKRGKKKPPLKTLLLPCRKERREHRPEQDGEERGEKRGSTLTRGRENSLPSERGLWQGGKRKIENIKLEIGEWGKKNGS